MLHLLLVPASGSFFLPCFKFTFKVTVIRIHVFQRMTRYYRITGLFFFLLTFSGWAKQVSLIRLTWFEYVFKFMKHLHKRIYILISM